MRHALNGGLAVAVVVGVVALAGCTPAAIEPTETSTPTSSPTPTPTPTPDPELVVDGTAGQNRPFFEFVLEGVLERSERPTSETIVNSLEASGFDRAAMEITTDITPVGELADSILVAVQIDGQCLIGQVADGQLTSQLVDVLGTGRCLVGRTLSLD